MRRYATIFVTKLQKRTEKLKNNVNQGHRERLRKRYLENGMHSLQDHEVLELLLFQSIPFKDTNRLAHELINAFGSLDNVLLAPPEKLMEVNGVSKVTATNLAMLKDLKERVDEITAERRSVYTFSEIMNRAKCMIGYCTTERALIVYLNSDMKYIAEDKLYSSSDHQLALDTQKIIESALRHNAKGVIVFHNHVNASCRPSADDVAFAESLHLALYAMKMVFVDHIIFNRDGDYYSFQEDRKLSDLDSKYKKLLGEK